MSDLHSIAIQLGFGHPILLTFAGLCLWTFVVTLIIGAIWK